MAADPALYLGLISGTSADGIDAALVGFEPGLRVLATATTPYRTDLRDQVLALTRSDAAIPLDALGRLDTALGACFADAALELLRGAPVDPARVRAIGSHGQTVRHRPDGALRFTLQLGDPTVIAERTGIRTIADFRRADVAAGGQGAPLAPAFHAAQFGGADATRVVLNLGGIANVTVLAPNRPVLGFDTGPANCLLDGWASRHLGASRDENGQWARSGRVDPALLARCLADPYLALAAPKSSGREYFNLEWLDAIGVADAQPEDVQATLLEFSVRSIADAIAAHGRGARDVVACGGGVHNSALMSALARAIAPIELRSSADLGLDPDYVEAVAFAWLAQERLAERPGNLPSVTGAIGPRLLGAIHAAPRATTGWLICGRDEDDPDEEE
jgi:anhydro-N-acetylmuramic acid kinase